MEKDNKNNIYFVFLIRIVNYQIKTMLKFQINSNKIKTIRDLKYFIIEQYKEKNFCPCQLMISDYFINELCYSNSNNTPDENIDKCFPDHNIYINVNSDTSCDCGFHNLNSLSKLELYERYMEKIRKLILKYECIINEKEREIKNLEELNDELLNNIDRRNKIQKDKEMEFITNDINSIVKFNQYNDNINFEDFYDIIININSIKQVNQGWDIKMNERGKLRFEEYKNKPALIIGMIGNSNKGKSFLLSKLSKISKIDLPSGPSISTEGLSIKYPDLEGYEYRKIVLLDSAGLETPVIKETKENNNVNEKELFKEKSREKLITEFFLQNYIIHNSDILLIVVGKFTYSEQKLLNKIKTDIQRAKLNKTVFIIHNLFTFFSKKQVEDHIQDYLLKSATFELEEGHKITTEKSSKNGTYYYEKNFNSNGSKIFHLIFANEGSEAGKFYNRFTLDFIKNAFQNVVDLKPFDVIETVKERFIEISNDIIELIDKNPFNKESFEETEEYIKLKDNQEIILKKCLIDELGFSILKVNGFKPTYIIKKMIQ